MQFIEVPPTQITITSIILKVKINMRITNFLLNTIWNLKINIENYILF